ncbi:MAG: FumA C-terminus/TtdB family hydratase beta subunit [Clostridia bacterium]|nr:FumA C-terminus/TtdB family hydratase beta subunit [Clostridia bacterium]
MSEYKRLSAPFDKAVLSELRAGDRVLLDGVIFTARDAAHKRLFEGIQNGTQLPIELDGQGIYYVGACFKDGKPISAGPTTAMRMDKYAPTLYDNGLAASIGKGDRGQAVYDAIVRNGGVYLAAIGGAGATYADSIKSSTLIAYPELGTEAIYRFEIKDFPLIVAIDTNGNNVYGH